MKRIVLLSVLLLIAGTAAAQSGGVLFEKNLSRAAKKARETDKMVFVDVYTTWCGPCRRLDEQVFPTEKAGAYMNEHFVSVRIDAEQDRWITDKYGIRAFPTLLILADDAETLLASRVGAPTTPESFVRSMKSLKTEADSALAAIRKAQEEKEAKKNRKK